MGVEWGTTATRLVRFAPTRKAYEKKKKTTLFLWGLYVEMEMMSFTLVLYCTLLGGISTCEMRVLQIDVTTPGISKTFI